MSVCGAGAKLPGPNRGGTPHTVTGDNLAWHSGPLNPGDAYRRFFATAGRFGYYCEYHGGMAGTITVVP